MKLTFSLSNKLEDHKSKGSFRPIKSVVHFEYYLHQVTLVLRYSTSIDLAYIFKGKFMKNE